MQWDAGENLWKVQRADIEFDSISLLLQMGGMVRFADEKVVEGGKEQTENEVENIVIEGKISTSSHQCHGY